MEIPLLKKLAKSFLKPQRKFTYYLPWLTTERVRCSLLLNNIEARFLTKTSLYPLDLRVTQYNESGKVIKIYQELLTSPTDVKELLLSSENQGKIRCGLVTIQGKRGWLSGIYLILSDGENCSLTHGRHEVIDHFPSWAGALIRVVSTCVGPFVKQLAAFGKDQFVYLHQQFSSHLIFLNLSTATNLLFLTLRKETKRITSRRLALPGLGSQVIHLRQFFSSAPGNLSGIFQLEIRATLRFNYYVIGAGPEEFSGSLSIQHVK